MNTNVREQVSVFKLAGFDGYIGLSGGTHIPILKYSQRASNLHKGFKLNVLARTYIVTVNHLRQILGSINGHPGTWNNTTLILFDRFICSVHNGKLNEDYEFKLYEKDVDIKIQHITYKCGSWYIMNIYHGHVQFLPFVSQSDWSQSGRMWSVILESCRVAFIC